MSMFVDVDDFVGLPYKIPNQEESKSLPDFIEKQEVLVLKKLLGLRLYTDFIAGLAEATPLQKWIDLRDGAGYEISDNADYYFEYKGLADFLKPFIYSEWIKLNYRKWTNVGMIVNSAQERSTAVNPFDEVVQYWNEFVTKVGYKNSQENTLYGFLVANEEDYEDLVFHYYPYKNTLDF